MTPLYRETKEPPFMVLWVAIAWTLGVYSYGLLLGYLMWG